MEHWRRRLLGLRLRDLRRALDAASPVRAAALAELAGCAHPGRAPDRRHRLARRLLLALPAMDDDAALVVAILLTAPLHDELLVAAASGWLRRDQAAVVVELAERWSPGLVALELALVTAEADPAG